MLGFLLNKNYSSVIDITQTLQKHNVEFKKTDINNFFKYKNNNKEKKDKLKEELGDLLDNDIVINKNDKVVINKIKNNNTKINIIDPYEVNVYKKTEKQRQKKSLEELKLQRINLSNIKKILISKDMEVYDINNKIKLLDEDIKNIFMNLSDEDKIHENINDLKLYLGELYDEMEINRVNHLICKYQNMLKNMEDKYDFTYEKPLLNNNGYNCFNKNLEDIIKKYDTQFKKDQIENEKEDFLIKKNKIIKSTIQSFINILNKEYNTNINYNIILNFLKNNMSNIKKEIYNNILNNLKINKFNKRTMLYEYIIDIIKIFTLIYYINNTNIDLKKVYKDIKMISDKDIHKNKNVKIISSNRYGKYVSEIDNKIYVDFGDIVEGFDKKDVEFHIDLIGMNILVTKGIYKGLICTVYSDNSDHLLVTKGIYGKNSSTEIPSLKIIKINKDSYELYKEQYKNNYEDFIHHNKDVYRFYLRKPLDIYPVIKYLFYYYNLNQINNFSYNKTFNISLDFYNIMIDKLDIFKKKVYLMKKKYLNEKEKLKIYKKNNQTKEYIELHKKLLKQNKDIKKYYKNNIYDVKINKHFLTENNKIVNTTKCFDYLKKTIKKNKNKNNNITDDIIINKLINKYKKLKISISEDIIMNRKD
jgi:hypothetical protein